MSIRKSAVDMPADEMEKFLEAIVILKATRSNQNFSVYDQYAALHGAGNGRTDANQ